MKIKNLAVIFSICAVSFLASCSKASTDPAPPGNTNPNPNPNPNPSAIDINITGMSFPATTTVKVGTTIVWKNKDAMAHTVTSDNGTTFSSGNLAAGADYSFKASSAGSFPYHCNYHSGMKGTIVVTP